jgi:hypothetical protein
MATYYISSSSGNDSTGTGTFANPWATLAKAVASSAANDMIVCLDGNFTWATQAFTSNRTIQAYNPNAVVFDGGGGIVRWYHNASNTVALTITINNITFRNARNNNNQALFSMPNIGGTAYINWVMNACNLLGLQVGSQSFDSGGVFGQETGGGNGFGVQLNGCAISVTRISGTSFAGVVMCRPAYVQPTSRIVNTVVYLPGTGATQLTGIFTGQIAVSSPVVTAYNNIYYAPNGTVPFFGSDNGWNATAVPQTYSCVNSNVTGAPSGTGNITADPKLIDHANGDFHLAQDSPCRGTGIWI